GQDSIMAYDAYNGQFLWEKKNEDALRTGVFQNYNPGNLVASEDSLFMMIGEKCVRYDAATGAVKATYTLPPDKHEQQYDWGYLAYSNGRLFGTATIRKEIEAGRRRRGRVTEEATDTIFCVDVETGRHLWSYEGKSISHHTIALSPDRVFFIDSSITPEQREQMLREDKSELKDLTPEQTQEAEEQIKRLDARLAVALDAESGRKLWARPVDVTDISEVGIGGGQLTLMYHNGVLVLCGANANGHFWPQFLAGEFKQRRLVALSAEGDTLWAKDANYRHRPIIIEDKIVAEPWMFDLYTGQQLTRPHPVTGEDVPWSIMRTGHHCGMLTGCPNMLMFRSGSTGFYDLEHDAGTRHFSGHRLGCWINAIPAGGLVMVPEASAGCVCLFSIAATITLEPREPRNPWAILSSVGETTPVKHLRLNLGAPGDRKDARGHAWITEDRPRPYRDTGLELDLGWKFTYFPGGGPRNVDEHSLAIQNAETKWLHTCWADGLKSAMIPLLGEEDSPAGFTLRLYFNEPDDTVKPGDRVFDVKVQGETVIEGLDILKESGGRHVVLVKEIPAVAVTDNVVIELVPKADDVMPRNWPVLNAIEVIRD
ncbi:MAG: malectin domain-containing carbohydrate-binding protein, partial [Planctomycetaceae bacterium]